jgi:hypothetical protein
VVSSSIIQHKESTVFNDAIRCDAMLTFRSIRNSCPNDMIHRILRTKVLPGIRLPDMRRERTICLVRTLHFTRVGEVKVVVAVRVGAEGGVIFEGGEIDWCTLHDNVREKHRDTKRQAERERERERGS